MPSASSSPWPQAAVLANITPRSNVSTERGSGGFAAGGAAPREKFRVLALYKFVAPPIANDRLPSLQSEVEAVCREYGARGTLLLAGEGINGTICYPHSDGTAATRRADDGHPRSRTDDDGDDGDELLMFLQEKFDRSLRVRISESDRPVFARLKVRIKAEIVTMHRDERGGAEPCGSDGGTAPPCCPTQLVGEYVRPVDWNELLLDPETLVVDTRNEYEIDVGTFRNAVNPHTQSFVEFPEWMRRNLPVSANGEESGVGLRSKPKKIAMFCTGGIRCEKATNACLQLVPPDVSVYHLEGGILAYLSEIPPERSLFDGDCYVFDQRVAVTYGLRPSERYSASCHGCRHPLSADDLQHEDHVRGVSCRYCVGKLSEKQQERFAQRQRQVELAMKEGRPHIFDPKELGRRV